MSPLTQSSQCWGESAPLLLPLWFPPDQRPSRFPHRLSSSFYGFLPTSVLQLSSQALLIPLWFPPDHSLPAFFIGSPHPSVVSSRSATFQLSSQALLIPLWFPADQRPSRFPHMLSSSLSGFVQTNGLPAFLTGSPHPFVASFRPVDFPLSSHTLLIPLWFPLDQRPFLALMKKKKGESLNRVISFLLMKPMRRWAQKL